MKELFFILPAYGAWHYSRALSEYIGIATNVLWFTNHFFSTSLLVRTFFAPWKRLNVPKGEKETFGMLFERFVIGTLMRGVGMILRGMMIVLGSTVWLGAAFMFFLGFLFWLLLPAVLIITTLKGIQLFLN